MSTDRQFACSFCGKRQSEVAKLIAGPQAFICNECVELCRTLYSPAPNSHPSPPDFVKLCMDCKWAQHHLVGVGHDVTGTWYCAHPSVVKRYKPDLVTGQARRSRGVRCAKVRKRDYDPTGSVEWCGPEGSFWQPRDEGHELLEFGFGDPPQSE